MGLQHGRFQAQLKYKQPVLAHLTKLCRVGVRSTVVLFPCTVSVSIAWCKIVHVPLSTHSDSALPRFAKDNARPCR